MSVENFESINLKSFGNHKIRDKFKFVVHVKLRLLNGQEYIIHYEANDNEEEAEKNALEKLNKIATMMGNKFT